MLKSIIVFLSTIAAVYAGCDNSCSGHGTCGQNGICQCYDNWGIGLSHLSGDCSERICPYELAWVDKPDKIGQFHKYAECANRGICNRESGECECFPGYEGKACQRTACPNDCSGHGRCMYIQDLPYSTAPQDSIYTRGAFLNQDPMTFNYYDWDKAKTRGCLCDPQWGDVDCSKRICDYGTDVMDLRQDLNTPLKHQIQKIYFEADAFTLNATNGVYGRTFALSFKSKTNETFTTVPIQFFDARREFHDFILDIESALRRLPNKVIDDVNVAGSFNPFGNNAYINITFVGENVQGPQNLITVRSYQCGDGCTPKITGMTLRPTTQNVTEVQLSDFNSFECGRRGKCDYTTGVCQCFAGYTGPTCGTISALV
jgi:hypothetical protein